MASGYHEEGNSDAIHCSWSSTDFQNFFLANKESGNDIHCPTSIARLFPAFFFLFSIFKYL